MVHRPSPLPRALATACAMLLGPCAWAAPAADAPPAASLLAATPASAQDIEFLQRVHPLNEASLEAARLAIVKADSEPVRKLGRDVIADQTTAGEELKRLASQHGIALPRDIDPAHQKLLNRLERASGAEFERSYLKLQKETGGLTLALFERQAREGSGAFKVYAEANLPKLQAHDRALGKL